MGNTERLKLFAEVSAVLTGFNVMELWGTGMMETYFEWVNQHSKPAELDTFYTEVAQLLSKNKTEAALEKAFTGVMQQTGKVTELVKAIITLWYMGQWNTAKTSQIPSPEAYQQGLIWLIGQTHPPGAKQPGYASWAKKPDM